MESLGFYLQINKHKIDLEEYFEGIPASFLIEIKAVPASRWREARDLRLRALRTEPAAFGSSYEEEEKLSDNDSPKSTPDWSPMVRRFAIILRTRAERAGGGSSRPGNQPCHMVEKRTAYAPGCFPASNRWAGHVPNPGKTSS